MNLSAIKKRHYFIKLLSAICCCLACYSCQQQDQACETFEFTEGNSHIIISLAKQSDTLYEIKAETFVDGKMQLTSIWPLNYPVFRFTCANITGDNLPEIAVGVVKPTRFDPKPAKRLFLFKLFEGYIRPLWLGSRMPQPLEDFRLIATPSPAIRSIEKEQNGLFLVAEYRWKGFGIEFIRYVKRNINIKEANKILNQTSAL